MAETSQGAAGIPLKEYLKRVVSHNKAQTAKPHVHTPGSQVSPRRHKNVPKYYNKVKHVEAIKLYQRVQSMPGLDGAPYIDIYRRMTEEKIPMPHYDDPLNAERHVWVYVPPGSWRGLLKTASEKLGVADPTKAAQIHRATVVVLEKKVGRQAVALTAERNTTKKLKREIKQRDQTIEQRDQTIGQRDQTIGQQDQTIEQRDQTIVVQKETIEVQKGALEILHAKASRYLNGTSPPTTPAVSCGAHGFLDDIIARGKQRLQGANVELDLGYLNSKLRPDQIAFVAGLTCVAFQCRDGKTWIVILMMESRFGEWDKHWFGLGINSSSSGKSKSTRCIPKEQTDASIGFKGEGGAEACVSRNVATECEVNNIKVTALLKKKPSGQFCLSALLGPQLSAFQLMGIVDNVRGQSLSELPHIEINLFEVQG
jgi:hypothetical protein